jgi:putative protease
MGVSDTAFELTTSISNLRHLAASDLGSYDGVYLGNLYCRRYEANLLERPRDLAVGLRRLRDAGKRAYVTTYAAPRNDTLPAIRRVLEVAAREGADAVEVQSVGVLQMVREEFPGLPVHAGSFANVYTDLGAAVLRDLGVRRITPHYELSLDEVEAIRRETGVPLELLIHGKMPLGISDTCILLEHEARWGVPCPDLCQQDVFLEKDGWGLKSVGTGILSGWDVCMLEHLPPLLGAGHRCFRIETVSESPAYRRAVGEVYREALTRALAGDFRIEPAWWETLRAHARLGLSNGFYFGRSGMDYVGAGSGAVQPTAPAS